MNEQELFSTPEFQNLHPVKQQIIKEMVSNTQGETPESILSKMMMVNKELSKRNLNFTKEESTILIQIIKQNMSPADQRKVDMLLGLFYR